MKPAEESDTSEPPALGMHLITLPSLSETVNTSVFDWRS